MWSAGNVVHEYTAQELRGIEIYKKKDVYCHTQQIRDLESDQIRYGWRLVHAPVFEAWVRERPLFLGQKEQDLIFWVGGKYSSEWHWSHFKIQEIWVNSMNLQMVNIKPSIMPSYAYLSDDEIKDLTAYIQTL